MCQLTRACCSGRPWADVVRLCAPLMRTVSRLMATSSEATKGLEEVDIFQLFIARSQAAIDPLSIEKRNPPEPDLLCRHSTEGFVAFELANLCDSEIAKVIAAGPRARNDAFSTSDPSAEIVRKKLKKIYMTSHPIELLVYSDGRLITPDDVIIPTITPILESRNGPYRRAWFMGEKATCLIWEAG